MSTTKEKPTLARHETFHPRFGWLKKGVDTLNTHSGNVFSDNEAPVILGVGKNMVNAIRYWVQAFKLIEPDDKSYRVSTFGTQLLADGGWDPYLESTDSLWLLHWHLLKSPTLATTWHYLFNEFPHLKFSVDELQRYYIEYLDTEYPHLKIALNSVKKDINCLMRMYSGHSSAKKVLKEDSLDSPFQGIQLITELENGRYQFNTGHKPTLSPAMIVYACLDFAYTLERKQTINVESLLHQKGSPGFVFKLSQSALADAIFKVSQNHPFLAFTEAAGLLQLAFDGDAQELAQKILESHYQSL